MFDYQRVVEIFMGYHGIYVTNLMATALPPFSPIDLFQSRDMAPMDAEITSGFVSKLATSEIVLIIQIIHIKMGSLMGLPDVQTIPCFISA